MQLAASLIAFPMASESANVAARVARLITARIKAYSAAEEPL